MTREQMVEHVIECGPFNFLRSGPDGVEFDAATVEGVVTFIYDELGAPPGAAVRLVDAFHEEDVSPISRLIEVVARSEGLTDADLGKVFRDAVAAIGKLKA